MDTTMQHLTKECSFAVLNSDRQLLIAMPDAHIANGTFDTTLYTSIEREYIAGPMRGYERWNFPAFDRARDQRLALGKQVVSPADLDRWRGFTEDMTDFPSTAFTEAMKIDTWALLNCTGIYMLAGWEESTGARYELMVAQATGMDIVWDEGAVVGQSVVSSVVQTMEVVA